MDVLNGFKSLVRRAIRTHADLLRGNLWPTLHDHCGVLINSQNKNKLSFILYERSDKTDDRYNNFYFRDPTCQGNINTNSEIVCEVCRKSLRNFQ